MDRTITKPSTHKTSAHLGIFLLIFLMIGSACTKETLPPQNGKITSGTSTTTSSTLTTPPTTSTTSKYLDIVIPPEQAYPMSFEKQVFYFENKITTTNIERIEEGKLGLCDVSIDYPNNLSDKNMQDYIRTQIDEMVSRMLQQGLPKYPGIIRLLEDYRLLNQNIHVFVGDTKNNIMKIHVSHFYDFSYNKDPRPENRRNLNESKIYYFDLMTGQEISINHIMNSKTGIEDLNQLIIQSIDAFVEPEDVNETIYLYTTPFRQAFQGLPNSFQINLGNDYFSIILDEFCLDCYFSHNWSQLYSSPTINLNNFRHTLYDRHYQPDLNNNASPGVLKFNQVTASNRKHDVVTGSESFSFDYSVWKYDVTKPHLLEASDDLLAQMQALLVNLEIQHKFRLADTVHSIQLTMSHGSILDEVTLHYYIEFNESKYISGLLSKSFHPVTKNEIDINDIFASNADGEALLRELFTRQITNQNFQVSIDTVMSEWNSIQVSLGGSGELFFTTVPYPNVGGGYGPLYADVEIQESTLPLIHPFW